MKRGLVPKGFALTTVSNLCASESSAILPELSAILPRNGKGRHAVILRFKAQGCFVLTLWVRQRGLAPERSEVPVPFVWPRVTRSASEMGTGKGDWLPSAAKCLSPLSGPESLGQPRKWGPSHSVSLGNGDRVTRSASEMGTESLGRPRKWGPSHSVGLGIGDRHLAGTLGASPHFRGRPRTKQPCSKPVADCRYPAGRRKMEEFQENEAKKPRLVHRCPRSIACRSFTCCS
jgi:hypothetical protein